jgi:hypothetical protein
MSDCLHCDIHHYWKADARQTNQSGGNRCEGNGGTCRPNFVAPPDDQSKLMADILANLGSLCS